MKVVDVKEAKADFAQDPLVYGERLRGGRCERPVPAWFEACLVSTACALAGIYMVYHYVYG